MNTLEFTLVVWATSLSAGFLGSLTGLGGGVIIIPALALIFGVDIRYAIGASLVSVIATSSGAAAAYVKEGFTNIRIGMFLEIATTIGALSGAFIAMGVSTNVIAIIFGVVLLWSAYESARPRSEDNMCLNPNRLAVLLKMNSSYPMDKGVVEYCVKGIPRGFGLMYLAGILSGLLGIGSGALKVVAMDRAMKVPFKVSTTTSNFMIGVTAATSAGVYLNRGYVDPGLVMPVMLGVLGGSMLGTRTLVKARTGMLRRVFALAIGLLALEMVYKGITGKI